MKMMLRFFILILIFTCISCDTDSYKKIERFVLSGFSSTSDNDRLFFGGVSIVAPDWETFDLINTTENRGYDHGFTNDIDSIKFGEAGFLSDSFLNADADRHVYSIVTINGMKAILKKPKIKGHGITGISFPHGHDCYTRIFGMQFNDRMDLTLYATNTLHEDELIRIFKTIRIYGINKCAGLRGDTTVQSAEIGKHFVSKDQLTIDNSFFKKDKQYY